MNGLKIGSFEFDIEKAKSELKDIGAERIMIQLPDGLRTKADMFMDEFDQETVIWGGSCYGACDIPKDIGENDALIHFGHAEIPNLEVDYPIIYLPGKSTKFQDIPEEIFENLEDKVALYAPIQHVHQLEKMENILSEKGYETVIGKGDNRIKYPGQVLGCNYSVKVKDADSHLYIGTGRFHPIGLSFSLMSDVLIYNPSTGQVDVVDEQERDDFLRKRFAAIAQAEECSKIGVLVSKKKGQRRIKTAENIKEIAEKEGKEIILIESDGIKKSSIDDLSLKCAVNTACPRIALDDSSNYDTVLLTPEELKITLKEKDWENWNMDEID
ncbi:MAG: diphthamide biosynthesis enzyme Dph2 [Candidatus Thermoplasmatota archaeon]